jgi:Tfp pilus assembly protein PilF
MIDYNKKMIDQKIASPYNYQTIYDAKLAQKDTAGALEYLKAGRKTFPNDVYLMNRETEIFLQKGEQEKALANLQAAIEKEPTNPQLQLVLGNVYDNLANPKGKSGKDTTRPADFDNMVTKAAEHYQKAIDLKPTNQESYFSALYNIGALYNNYGGTLQTKANNLSLAEAKTKGKELEAKSQEFYKKAIPYIEQALIVKSDDKSCMIALRKLYYLTGNEAAGKAMSDKLKGGK